MYQKLIFAIIILITHISTPICAQVWINANASWAVGNTQAPSMALYGNRLYVGTSNSSGAQVWSYGATSITPVPTITEWGMIILIAFLGVGSVYYLTSQRLVV